MRLQDLSYQLRCSYQRKTNLQQPHTGVIHNLYQDECPDFCKTLTSAMKPPKSPLRMFLLFYC